MAGRHDVCVAHLVRKSNSPEAFRAFLDSYARVAAGVPHDVLIIFKGFSRAADLSIYDAMLNDIPHARAFVRDFGFDVGPYLKVGREHDYRFYLFLNSFSRLLVPGWLESMYRHVTRPDVGVVGATASHQSILTDYVQLRREYRPWHSLLRRKAANVVRFVRYIAHVRGRFIPFPNYHVRSNAFMISREVLVKLRCPAVLSKWHAYRFESGARSMTWQVIHGGLRALLIGADGRAYEPMDWPDARTFWISRQENLLVSDNQTRMYETGDPAMRERLAFHAWRRHPDGSPRSTVPPIPDSWPRRR